MSQAFESDESSRVLCYDRFENEIFNVRGIDANGFTNDDKTCISMFIAGTVGVCFEGEAQVVVDQINSGAFEYSRFNKINKDSAKLISENIIQFGSYEAQYVGWTRSDNELFRCPDFDKIKDYTTRLADELDSTVDYAVARRYRQEHGLPFWLLDDF